MNNIQFKHTSKLSACLLLFENSFTVWVWYFKSKMCSKLMNNANQFMSTFNRWHLIQCAYGMSVVLNFVKCWNFNEMLQYQEKTWNYLKIVIFKWKYNFGILLMKVKKSIWKNLLYSRYRIGSSNITETVLHWIAKPTSWMKAFYPSFECWVFIVDRKQNAFNSEQSNSKCNKA